ncbi:MAG TPA: BMP family ABC transporter substrate-binding protein, partial [Terriglobales bacterium]|nr:BMP family ABC transporter substrate-binding protein [Terriglobales bacterium]
MKKLLALMLCLALVLSLAACAKKTDTDTPPDGDTTEPVRIANLINGNLGDLSFFDSAKAGMDMISAEYGDKVQIDTVEMSYDNTKWEPSLLDACEEGYDVVICGTWQMTGFVENIADTYPDITFLMYDTSVDWTKGTFANVHCIEYKQNEGSYLAGLLAASMSKTGKLGFVGGIDNDVIKDFLVGYVEGAKSVNPDIQIAVSYVGGFSDSATGKDLALAQFAKGVDVNYGCAGQAGLGVFEAAVEKGGKEAGLTCIGVDSDQGMIFMEQGETAKAEITATSMLKRVDLSLFDAVKAYMDGTLTYGETDYVGMAEECVGLAENELYTAIVPEDIRAKVADASAKLQSGEITCGTAFGLSI